MPPISTAGTRDRVGLTNRKKRLVIFKEKKIVNNNNNYINDDDISNYNFNNIQFVYQ